MNIILFGPPGAGKGTQADKIMSSFGKYKISSGDILRDEIKKETKIGKKIKSIIDKGSFVSDIIIDELIEKVLSNKKFTNNIIFDGYPRNLNQALKLDLLLKKYNQEISCVLNLNVDEELIKKRILGRQICTNCDLIFNEFFNPSTKENHNCDISFLVKRSDDNEETISKRYKTYIDKTLPILDYYKKLNLLHEIDGKTDIDQIFEQISRIIASLET